MNISNKYVRTIADWYTNIYNQLNKIKTAFVYVIFITLTSQSSLRQIRFKSNIFSVREMILLRLYVKLSLFSSSLSTIIIYY